MRLVDFYAMKKKEARKNGSKFTMLDLCRLLGCSSSRLSIIYNATKIITMKMADIFEEKTDGVLTADDLIEESIKKYRKRLVRKKRFGNLNGKEKRMKQEILGNDTLPYRKSS